MQRVGKRAGVVDILYCTGRRSARWLDREPTETLTKGTSVSKSSSLSGTRIIAL